MRGLGVSDSPEPAVLRKGALASSLCTSWSYLVTPLVIMTWYERVGPKRPGNFWGGRGVINPIFGVELRGISGMKTSRGTKPAKNTTLGVART